jgi:hypothetical protein
MPKGMEHGTGNKTGDGQMNLDRFAYGMEDLQERPLLGICIECGNYLYTEALHVNRNVFCEEYCYEKWLRKQEVENGQNGKTDSRLRQSAAGQAG